MIFDRYANIVASHQIEFPQYYPQPGWHEHDSDQIIESCDACIDQACVELEKLGWTRESVKVIGACLALRVHCASCASCARSRSLDQASRTSVRQRLFGVARRGSPSAAPSCGTTSVSRILSRSMSIVRKSKVSSSRASCTREKKASGRSGRRVYSVEGLRASRVTYLLSSTGLPISTYFSALKLRWMIDHWEEVKKANNEDDLCFGTVESWIVYVRHALSAVPRSMPDPLIQRLTGGANGGVHISDVSNASRTLLLNLKTLDWDPHLLKFFGIKANVLPKLVSSSEVYGKIAHGALKGVEIAGLAGDQQAALVGNKCLMRGEAKCTYGTGAFLLVCTGEDIVESKAGLLTTVNIIGDRLVTLHTHHRFIRSLTKTAPTASRCTVSRAVVRAI